jgi:hypothetical protein
MERQRITICVWRQKDQNLMRSAILEIRRISKIINFSKIKSEISK